MKNLYKYIILMVALVPAITAKAQTVFTLSQAVESACKNNADLQKRRMDTESMKLLKKQLFTKYFPTVSASATGFMRNRGFAEGSDILNTAFELYGIFVDATSETDMDVKILKYGVLTDITAKQPIYTGGRLTSANKLAALGVKATSELTAIKEEELTKEVEKYFWQLVQLYEADRSLVTMDSLVDKARHDASLALKAGLVTPNDKMEVDLYASTLESNHLQIDNGKKLCREYLAYLVGVECIDSVVWNDIYTLKSPENYYLDPSTALLDRHETKLLQMKKDAALLQKKFTLGTLLPTVGAVFSFNYHYFSASGDGGLFHDYLDTNPTGWWAGVAVSVPISDWWGGRHKLKRSQITIRQAEIDYNDKQKLMKVELSQKWNTLTEKYKQVDVAHRHLQQAVQNQKQHASAYRSGAATMTDRLHADALYEKSRTNYIDACIKYRIAITEYMHASGRNSLEDK